MPKASLPLKNLRGVLILLILAFHSFSAYIVSQPAHAPLFDQAPYDWRAFPIIDSERWIGFDLFCAFQFLYLMQLMFFLSGLFVWPSLRRRGWKPYLYRRVLRLGVPFLLGTYVLMPVAFYPVYLVTAADRSWSSFWSQWMALPITPTGPMWFLWFLIALDIGAVALYRLQSTRRLLATHLAGVTASAGRCFVVIICISTVAYLPLSAAYSPWKWVGVGPFEVQAAFAPQYMIYFLFGLAAGAYGYERGLFSADGMLARRWPIWLVGASAAFLLWIVPTALIVKRWGASIAGLHMAGELGVVIFAAAACFGLTAVFLRFADARWPIVDGISEDAYGIYFFHYPFVLWLQFSLLGIALPAVSKGAIVLAAALLLSWAASIVTNRTLANARALAARVAPIAVKI